MKIGIIAALPEEIKTLTHRKIARGCSADISEQLIIAHAGAGPANARKAAAILLEQNVDAVISWGCAAALETGIKPGSLAVPSLLIGKNQKKLSLQSAWHDSCRKTLASKFMLCAEKLADSSTLVTTSTEKISIHNNTGAQCLDMESMAIAQTAQNAGIPCLVIRAIADPVTMDLPNAIRHALSDTGEIRMKKLLLFLLFHPNELMGLIRLGLHFNAAARTLKSVAQQLDIIAEFNPEMQTLTT